MQKNLPEIETLNQVGSSPERFKAKSRTPSPMAEVQTNKDSLSKVHKMMKQIDINHSNSSYTYQIGFGNNHVLIKNI